MSEFNGIFKNLSPFRFSDMTLELAEFLPALVEAFGGELSMTTQGEA